MGNSINGKTNDKEKTYYESQINLFRWRADPNFNAFLPRIHFCKKSQEVQRRTYNHLLARQLDQQFYIDVEEINHLLASEKGKPVEGELILFEKYAARLSQFQGQLNLGQCLYVLNGLLQGYERILHKFQKTYIENEYCFVTLKGEVRAWFTNSPTSNEFIEELELENEHSYGPKDGKNPTKYTSEAGVMKRLLELNILLSNCSQEYLQFHSQINEYISINILHHSSLISARKFINKYLFSHRIILPYNILPALQRITSRQNSVYCPSQREVEFGERPNETSSTKGLFSTDATFDCFKGRNKAFAEHENNRLLQIKHFLKIPYYAEKASMAKISENQESKLTYTPTLCCKTPANERHCHTLQSTFVHSQMVQSRDDIKENEGKTTINFQSRTREISKNKDFLGNKYSQFPEPSLGFKKNKRQSGYKSAKVSVKFHSRQPSLEQETNSMFVSPSNEKVDFTLSYSHLSNVKNQIIPEDKEEDVNGSVKRATHSNKDEGQSEKKQETMLVRQVSGLVSNKQLSICQSLGTFQSIEYSKDSGYRGVLTMMGRTAKMLNLPTGKKLTLHRHSPEGASSSGS